MSKAKYITVILLVTLTMNSYAWGPKGHAIVAKIAMHFLKPDVRQNVLNVLGDMPVDTAANWMDIMRSNADYDYMKPWHYIDFDKDEQYEPSTDENIVSRLIITFNELKHKKTLCNDQVKTDLLVLMHLMGDLHQPLHTGYADDLGGNKRAVQFDTLKTNLHHFWDEDIIDRANITLEDCINQQFTGGALIEPIDFVGYMKNSRSLLDTVYDFPDYTLNNKYLQRNALIVKRQLLIAGLRLAAMLNKVFFADAPIVDAKELAAKYKNGIEANEAKNYIGKSVTVCSRVYGIKTTDKVTFINVGAKFPNSPLTVVIFAKSRANFTGSIEELYSDKNICVKGKVVEYNGKAEIIVEDQEDIIVQ